MRLRTRRSNAGGRRFPPTIVVMLLAMMVALALVSAVHASRNAFRGGGDLYAPRQAAEILQKENVYQRYLRLPPNGAAGRGPASRLPGFQPVQVPSVLTMFWPFTQLSWPAARAAWLALNLLFTAGIVFFGFRRFLPGRQIALAIAIGSLFVMSVSWRNVIANGQHLLAALFFFLAAAELADRRRNLPAGLLLALSLIKYSTTLFLLPYLLFKRQWAPVAIAVALHGLVTVAIAVRLGESPVTLVAQSLSVAGELRNAGYIDLFSLTADAGISEGWAAAGAAILLALVLGAASRRAGRDDRLVLAMLSLVSAVLVYHNAYDLAVLIIPLFVAIERWPRDRTLSLAVFAIVALVWFVSTGRTRIEWLEGRGVYHYLIAALWYGTLALMVQRGLRGRSVAGDDPSSGVEWNTPGGSVSDGRRGEAV